MPKKQKSGLYRTKITIGHEPDGKPIVKYISGKTKAELEREKKKAITYYIDGSLVERDRIFGEYATEWYQLRKEKVIAPSTRASYRSMLNKYVLPTFGDRNMRAIRTNDIQAWLNTFAGNSDTTITLAATVIRSIMRAACADGILAKDPTAFLILPKAAAETPRRALTDDETKRVLGVIDKHEKGHYLAVLYYLGVRPGEARGLQWGDFDWENDLVHIQRDIDYTTKDDPIGELKTEAADRNIPVPGELKALLWARIGSSADFVFQGRGGAPLAKASAERLWLDLMEMAGLVEEVEREWKHEDVRARLKPTITPYYLRHNFITLCWEAGLDPLYTMRIVGHEDYRTTANIYTHLKNEHLQHAKKDIEAMFESKRNPKVAQKLHKPDEDKDSGNKKSPKT